MPRTEDEKKLIKECIESYQRMIKYHRKQILELKRKLLDEPKSKPFNLEIKNENR